MKVVMFLESIYLPIFFIKEKTFYIGHLVFPVYLLLLLV